MVLLQQGTEGQAQSPALMGAQGKAAFLSQQITQHISLSPAFQTGIYLVLHLPVPAVVQEMHPRCPLTAEGGIYVADGKFSVLLSELSSDVGHLCCLTHPSISTKGSCHGLEL